MFLKKFCKLISFAALPSSHSANQRISGRPVKRPRRFSSSSESAPSPERSPSPIAIISDSEDNDSIAENDSGTDRSSDFNPFYSGSDSDDGEFLINLSYLKIKYL